jgi:hypothetical protein
MTNLPRSGTYTYTNHGTPVRTYVHYFFFFFFGTLPPALVVVDGNHSLAASIKDWREQADGRQSAVKCLLSDEAALAMVPLVAS